MADTLNVCQYHGPRNHITSSNLEAADLVLTTYATIASDFGKRNSVLHDFAWFRIVLDEGISTC